MVTVLGMYALVLNRQNKQCELYYTVIGTSYGSTGVWHSNPFEDDAEYPHIGIQVDKGIHTGLMKPDPTQTS